MSEAELLKSVLALSRPSRVEFARRLVESLADGALDGGEWDRAALQEARRRWASIDAGEATTTPALDAVDRLLAGLGDAR